MSALGDALTPTIIDRDDESMRLRATIDPVFTIGPKVHGGSAQALIVNAAHAAHLALTGQEGVDLADVDGAAALPVAATSTYLNAPDPAEVELVARLVKRGRTVSVVDVELSQGGRAMITTTVVIALLDHGEPRHSAAVPLRELPVEPAADALHLAGSPMEEIMHMHPVVDFALDPATFPAAVGGRGEPTTRGWVRPTAAAADLPFVTLVCDISPPVVMNLGVFGWAPTVTLATYLRRIPAAAPASDGGPGWLRFENRSIEVGQGMFESDHTVLDSTGVVVGQSRQLALIPAKPVPGPTSVK
ncbi:MAG: thioesterase family protein [Gordonia sp. (in: high G+C Gram-positive bacteria)]|uniref:thioesterase family protein n=1 Tax=Gordonia sp. (in: high G+C Gram-positive bacteria) TaxID=84139 RepID=UPI0039E406DE